MNLRKDITRWSSALMRTTANREWRSFAVLPAACGIGRSVQVPAGLLPNKNGVPVTSTILADSVRQIDYREREIEFVATAPRELVEDVIDKVFTVFEE